jgi:transcription elongation factor GreA
MEYNSAMNKKPAPVRPLSRMRFTKDGYEKLQAEHAALLAERPSVVADVTKAREMGDLKENGYYQASKAKLRSIDSQLMRVSYNLKTAIIMESNESDGVSIGSTVTFTNQERELSYQFVGDLEANPSEKKLSLLSPIGRAIEGKKVGETFDVDLPTGKVTYTIKKIS